MATKTASDVITHALRKMNVTPFGADNNADIYALAESEYTTLHNELRAKMKRVYRANMSWSSGSVPEEVFAHVASILAGRLTETIPVSAAVTAKASFWTDEGEARLREYLSRPIQRTERWPDFPPSQFSRRDR